MIRLFRVPVGALTLLVSEIVLLATAFVVATYATVSFNPGVFLFYDRGWIRIAIVIASVLVGLYLHNLYTNLFVQARMVLLQQLLLITGCTFLLQGFLSFLDADLRVPIRVMILGSALSVFAIFCWRLIFGRYVLPVFNRDVLLQVGGSPMLEDIAAASMQARSGKRGATIHQELDFGAEPGRIYEALLDSKQFSGFTGRSAEIQAQPGGSLKLFDGLIEGRNIELVANQRILQAWREASWEPGHYSLVTFDLAARGAGTHLVFDQSGIAEKDWGHLNEGWPVRYWEPMRKYFQA